MPDLPSIPAVDAGRQLSQPRYLDRSRYPDRRGTRFVVFSAIGAAIFLLGLGIQAALTGGWHLPPGMSYLIQAVMSVQASFLLNRWLTWRDRDTPGWLAAARFHAQKTLTIALNLALYLGLLWLGMNYLVANTALTAVFTAVNYIAGDRLVFTPRRTAPAVPAALAGPACTARVRQHLLPGVSVVLPCRGNERTIGAAVQSLLDQDYARLHEIILVGSPGERTWSGLAGIADPRLALLEVQSPPGVRDANFKRDAGITATASDLVALVDSDIVLPRDWLSLAVAALESSGTSCVAGGLRSIHDSFWGRYTDNTVIGAKTPRIAESYTVTSEDFGTRGRKPPITANTLFTRELYDRCPIDPSWSHGSYEDYEWFWRVTRAGYHIRVCRDLFGWHHHRRGLRALAREYRRSSRGCAYFIRAHLESPLAKRRLRQALLLPLAAAAVTIGAAGAAADGYWADLAALALGCAALLAAHQVVRSRRLESAAYPAAGFALGLVFTAGLVAHLIRSRFAPGSPGVAPGSAGVTPAVDSAGVRAAAAPRPPAGPPAASGPAARRGRPPLRCLLHPLTAICAVQAALSLTLVWSNTAFGDEGHYLWAGHLEISHWLHGTPVPQYLARLSGSPVIYPPLGALADSIGGLAGARILSLVIMLGATILLYLTASRLIGRTGAVFAAALWAASEPAIRLAFATYDPLSVLLTALSAWLAVQAGHRRRRGELVAASALALALANATAYSGIVIDPVVLAFAFLGWLPHMRAGQASSCAAWLAGGWALFFGMVMTVSHSWAGTAAVFSRSSPDRQSLLLVLNDIWAYSGLIIGLAVIGAAIAVSAEGRRHAALLALLAGAAFVVPAAQLHDQTAWSLDKHIAYGIWFAVMAAGYGCSKLIRWLPGARRQLAALCCVLALAYPVEVSWEAAWEVYHAWPDARSFVAAFAPAVARSRGPIYVPGQQNVAEYYTPQGRDWARWRAGLPLDPAAAPRSAWTAYYTAQLHHAHFGVIALFYAASSGPARLPGSILPSSLGSRARPELPGLAGIKPGEPGLPALTRAVEGDPQYRLAAVGPYDTSNLSGSHDYGVFAIWQRKA